MNGQLQTYEYRKGNGGNEADQMFQHCNSVTQSQIHERDISLTNSDSFNYFLISKEEYGELQITIQKQTQEINYLKSILSSQQHSLYQSQVMQEGKLQPAKQIKAPSIHKQKYKYIEEKENCVVNTMGNTNLILQKLHNY